MKVDFEKIALVSHPNFKGGEKQYDAKIFDDGAVKIMQGKLVPGASIGMHQHTDSCEVIYILKGQGTVVSPDGKEIVNPGEVTYCMKNGAHSLVNNGDSDLMFFAVVPKQ